MILDASELKKMLANGQLIDVISFILNEDINKEYYNEVILISSNYQDILKKLTGGVLSYDEFQQKQNRVISNLLQLLDRLEEIFIKNLHIEGLLFFESGFEFPPVSERKYKVQFMKDEVKYLNCQLNLKYYSVKDKIDFVIKYEIIKPDGDLLTTLHINALIEKGWVSSQHNQGYGWSIPGNWENGIYQVNAYIGKVFVKSAKFEII